MPKLFDHAALNMASDVLVPILRCPLRPIKLGDGRKGPQIADEFVRQSQEDPTGLLNG